MRCGCGYAKPVPVNPRNFANPKRDIALTALAGPASNLLMALVSLLLLRVAKLATGHTVILAYVEFALPVFARVNLGLAVFNLLPIPPLDGYRIFSAVLPSRWVYYMEQYQPYFRWGIILLIATGVLSLPIELLVKLLGNLLCVIVGLPVDQYF